MAGNDHAEEFIGKLRPVLEDTTEQLITVHASPDMYLRRYDELLTAARATGELDDYHGTLYVDEETGLLAARLCLALPRYRGMYLA